LSVDIKLVEKAIREMKAHKKRMPLPERMERGLAVAEIELARAKALLALTDNKPTLTLIQGGKDGDT
jgi:hypothetical protein